MSEEIKVTVCMYPDRKNLVLRYVDPITGKQKTKSAGTPRESEAIKAAGNWEDELRSGRYQPQSKVTWTEFRKRYEREKGAGQSQKTLRTFQTAANHVERVLNPDRLCKLTSTVLSRFQARLREDGMAETTIGSILRHLRASLSWAVAMGMLPSVPKMAIPRNGNARARAVDHEEFGRMIEAVPKTRPDDAPAWIRYLRGLYLGGLRLEESLALSWDADAPFAIDLTGRRPAFRIAASAHKARRDERLPMTEDFYNLIMETPKADRQGKVFKLNGLRTGQPITAKRVCRLVSSIGKKADVVVAAVEKRVKKDGQLVTVQVKKFASAHDLRRAFGTRWASRVMPAVLRRLMRHAEIGTTMKYYVTMDADAVGDEVWGRDWDQGNILGNTGQKQAPKAETAPAEVSTEAVEE
jgi:integrase